MAAAEFWAMSPREFSGLVYLHQKHMDMTVALAGAKWQKSQAKQLAEAFGAL